MGTKASAAIYILIQTANADCSRTSFRTIWLGNCRLPEAMVIIIRYPVCPRRRMLP